MDLGLALPTLQDVSEELVVYQSNDETILSIEVFDETGAVLFSTDPSFIGDPRVGKLGACMENEQELAIMVPVGKGCPAWLAYRSRIT